jgi:propanol-preferring alcohol dehydrogenase
MAMKAMMLNQIVNLLDNPTPLSITDIPVPSPAAGEVLIRVTTCGVCHTELDEIEGRTPPSKLPMILGHQVVGYVVEVGEEVEEVKVDQRVGVAWIFSACGNCRFCQRGEENLCADFKATGRDVYGGYAEYIAAPADYVHPIPENITAQQAAPLLCAGAIGYRSLKLAGIEDGQNLGLTGFGASAHLVLKLVRYKYPHTDVFVFARNPREREFAVELGAVWAGDTTELSPVKLHSIIDTTPVWKPVVEALENLSPGGRLVINAIRKEEIDKEYLLRLDYPAHLWMEKEIKSVANVTRKDVRDFLDLAAEIPIEPTVQEYPLADTNQAIMELKRGEIRGAKVLQIGQ